MRHPGYVRNFSSVVAELGRRGHHVHLSFDGLNTKWMGDADPLGGLADAGHITYGRSPHLRTGWQRLATGLRACDDYLRYQGAEYANAPKLRARAEQRVPAALHGPLNRLGDRSPRAQAAIRALDRSIRVDERLEGFIRKQAPDIVLVTPLVGLGSTQADYLKAARALGIPGGLCVASWDNLTNKGLIREDPDLVAVWNEAQRTEAIELHGTPSDQIAITGAHTYDHWFTWAPNRDREAFCAAIGLDPRRPYILYLGSSPFIAPNEHPHVTRWLRGLRARPERELQEVGVLVRPHPQNAAQWADADFGGLEDVAVYPRTGADPVDRERKADFFDSIHHAALVVGVNTSAQIESAIVGRSVFSVLAPDFSDTQRGTLHFEHLAADADGLLHLAATATEHEGQLLAALRDPAADDARRSAFLERFVRPYGLDEPAAPRLADAIEAAARAGLRPALGPRLSLRRLLAPIAFGLELTGGRRNRPFAPRASAIRLLRRWRKRLWRRGGKRLWRRWGKTARRTAKTTRRTTLRVAVVGVAAGRAVVRGVRLPRIQERVAEHRILFFMNYPGYLRYFDATIRELAERGNTVLIVLDRPEKQAEGLIALETMPASVRVVGQTPRRSDLLGPTARGLRGTVDYVRYLHPRYADADYLRDRRRKALDLAPRMRPLGRLRQVPTWVADLMVAALRTAERAVPSDASTEAFISGFDPDLVVVTPLVSEASPQTDIVKSAQRLGIPTALSVASWDHLTTKGLVRVHPDRVIVWNETQAREAREFHAIDPSRVVVTGAQPFDRWFGRTPSTDREAFCARVGLPSDRPYVLFVGSTPGISGADAEKRFVRAWIAALRTSGDPTLRELGILVRPHPYNPGTWTTDDVAEHPHVAVWPRRDANPVDENDRHDYFDSIFHSAAVVGINTSAMIEAAISRRPVHTIRSDDFSHAQEGTLHFHYLLPENGGFLRVADSIEEHLDDLADTIAHPDAAREQLDRFVGAFVRPHGREQAGTPLLADALENLAVGPRPRPWRVPRALLPLTGLLYASAVRRRYDAEGMLAKDTMLASRRATEIARESERGSPRKRGADRLFSRARRRSIAWTTRLEQTASERYRREVPKRDAHDHPVPGPPAAAGDKTPTETQP